MRRALAALPPEGDLTMPSRHLGLVQAEERDGLDFFLDRAADWLHLHLDRAALEQVLQPLQVSRPATLAALMDRMDPGRTGKRHDDAGGSQDA